MTLEERRKVMALECDWTERHPYPELSIWEGPMGEQREDGQPPDYLNDLNEIHTEIMLLPTNLRDKFETELQKVAFRLHRRICELDAKHHVEAFLRVFGKWDKE